MKDCECHSHKEDSHGKFPRICHLLSFFFFLKIMFFRKKKFRNTTKVPNSLYSRSVESDLGPNCLQRLSADVTIRIRVKRWRVFGKVNCATHLLVMCLQGPITILATFDINNIIHELI